VQVVINKVYGGGNAGARMQRYVGPTLGTVNQTTGAATSNAVFYISTDRTRPFRTPSGIQGPGLLRVDSRTLGRGLDVQRQNYVSARVPVDYGPKLHNRFGLYARVPVSITCGR
jgi:hypothetical protein